MTTETQTTRRTTESGNRGIAIALRFFELFESLGVLVMIVLVVALVSTATPNFLQPHNVSSVLVSAAIIAVPALGMTLALAMGALDLSIGSLQALAACAVAILLGTLAIPLSIGATLLLGSLVGLVNGLIVTRLGVPAFVATLGMMSVLRGAALLITDGQSILLMDQPEFARLNTGQLLGVPIPVLTALGAFVVLWLVMRHTPFGQHVCAIGGNERAAIVTGLKVDRIKVLVFVIVGVTAALSGVMLTSRLMIVDGTLGVGLELQAIAVVVLGGTSLMGGNANLTGTMLAAVLLAVINSALNILKVESFYQYLALGLLLIFALALDTLRRAIVRRAVTEGRL
jgi:ribose/xylose/arabinose/galactoside ABC-type transport system permease subunit